MLQSLLLILIYFFFRANCSCVAYSLRYVSVSVNSVIKWGLESGAVKLLAESSRHPGTMVYLYEKNRSVDVKFK